MPDYGGRYEDNGDGYGNKVYGDASPPLPKSSGFDDLGLGHSLSQRDSHNHERGSSKGRDRGRESRDREREKESRDRGREREKESRDRGREKERHRDRDRNRDRDIERERDKDRDRDTDQEHRHRDRSERREHHHRSRDYDRHKDYDINGHHGHSPRSRSKGRSSHRSRYRSRSRSKSKCISGFDMASPASAMMPDAASSGQITGLAPPIPGISPNMYPMATGQLQALTTMPFHAMPQQPQATRHARRVYVGGLSPAANEQSVATFFSQVMSAIGGNTAGPGDAVVNVYINYEKKFAFVEMRSVEEASNAMALDGIIFEGAPVKVRRPTDYNSSLAGALGSSQPSSNLNLAAVGLTPGSAGGLEGPDRIFVGGLPYYFNDAQIRELLESFGALRGFDLVKDRETGNSKGYAFCVYQDLAVTDIACAALNGIKMGDKTLTVRRANQTVVQPRPEQENVLLQAQQQVAIRGLLYRQASLPTKVVCLTQVISPDELKDDEEYADIMEDMREEGGKYGKLVNIVIPRPGPNGEPASGVGKVFLEYDDTDGSTKARVGFNGRKFGGNQAVAVFYPESNFIQGDYQGA